MTTFSPDPHVQELFGKIWSYYNSQTGDFLDQSFLGQLPVANDLKTLLELKERNTKKHVQDVIKNVCDFSKGNWDFDLTTHDDGNSDRKNGGFYVEVRDKHLGEKARCRFLGKNHAKEGITVFLILCAIYHDIGKIFQMDRHPVIGYYHVTYPTRASEFLKLLHPDHFYMLSLIIKYHDVPGVINTGEGSLLAALDFFPAVTNAETKQDITDLFYVFNLADLKASVPTDEEFSNCSGIQN
jgi:hypothetical protein